MNNFPLRPAPSRTAYGHSGCSAIRNIRHRSTPLAALLAAVALTLATTLPARADGPAAQPATPPFSRLASPDITRLPPAPLVPKTVADLNEIQARVEAVVREALPATVAILLEDAQGSGVIVSPDGYVLTAGHVSGKPNQHVMLVLANGRRVRAVTLGANNGIDSGMLKILDKGKYPFVPLGSARDLTSGQWVVSLGHPGGYHRDRPPVVRLGRVLTARATAIDTDCPLFSGDSGGPMLDLDGRLVGIHSRIGAMTTINIDVPIDTYENTWERLAKGDEWGSRSLFASIDGDESPPAASLGLRVVQDVHGALVQQVYPGAGAWRSGLLEGDIITSVNGKPVKSIDDLKKFLTLRKPGDTVTLQLLRAARHLDVSVNLTTGR